MIKGTYHTNIKRNVDYIPEFHIKAGVSPQVADVYVEVTKEEAKKVMGIE